MIILAGTFYLRGFNSSKIPFPGESMDEYSFSWVGLSLIQLGTPVGISGIPGYKNYDHRYINVDNVFKSEARGNTFPINAPWFDHPPVLGLITGGYAYSQGARVFEDTMVNFIRKPMIVLGTLSVLLLFIFIKNIFGTKEAIISSLIYATSPLAIISSRMVQAENLLIPIFLLSLITTYFYLTKQKTWILWLSAIIAGTSLLVKLSGLSIILSNLFLILYFSNGFKKTLPSLITYSVVSLSFLIFFFSYGQAYDFDQFLSILSSNSNRVYSVGPNAFYDLLTVTRITAIRYLTDGWFLAGIISAILLFVIPSDGKKKEMYILIPLIGYLIIFLLFGSEPYGWYRFPFIPFLFAAIARVLILTVKNPQYILPSFLILLLPIGVNILKVLGIEDFQEYSGIWRWGLVGLLLILLFTYMKQQSLLIKILLPIILIGLFIFSIYLNLEYFWKITPEFWRSAT